MLVKLRINPATAVGHVPPLLTIGIALVSFLLPSLAQAPPDGKHTFAEIVEKFIVQRNGEVVLDVRTSDSKRWQQELLDRTAPWRMARISPDAFGYVVIHEYNRYHSIQLDRDQNVLSLTTAHADDEPPLSSSGPDWNNSTPK